MSRLFSTITSKNAGQPRPRSDSPPDTSADAESAPSTSSRPSTSDLIDLITQSPTTDRIVKKGRAGPDVPAGAGPSPPPSTPTTPTPTPRSSDPVPPGPRPGFPSSSICPVTQWPECRKKVVNGVRSLMTDVNHLVTSRIYGGHKPMAGYDPKGSPRLFDEILHLRLMADELQAAYYPSTVSPTTADNTPPTPTPPPTAPVEADTMKPTYTYAAKVATPPPAPAKPTMKPPTTKPQQKPRLPDKPSPPPTTSRSAPQRLILRFANSSVINSVADPQSLRDSFNVALKGASKLKAVNRS
ncbi:hypothetical protein B0H12DRAFT_1312656, partial [Mycena haematopus]